MLTSFDFGVNDTMFTLHVIKIKVWRISMAWQWMSVICW